MTFNSLEFAIFLPIFMILFYAVYKRNQSRDLLLLLGSYIFYMSWNWKYAGLIAISTGVDFFVGQQLGKETKEKKRKIYLVLSLIINLGILAIFKYYNFFIESSQGLLGFFNINVPNWYHHLLLPVGISFYTFQTLSYTIDVFRKKIEPEKSLIKFAVFVSFFPQLVAGPIVRAKDFLPQINRNSVIQSEEIETGLRLIFTGLFKKIIIADLLAYLAVDAIFKTPELYSSFDLLMGLYAYSFQIYCDFSGYSDIAIGLALLMGFKLPMNFNRPYISQSPSEFWKRWHISLSSWLRDYLYISLGGNRGSQILTLRNLMITMLLGGLWHGAAYNFILWGAFHGLLLVLMKNVKTETVLSPKMVFKIFFNYHLVLFGWLLFRVTSMENFLQYINGLSHFTGGTDLSTMFYLVLIFAAVSHYIPKQLLDEVVLQKFDKLALPFKPVVYVGLIFLFLGASVGTPAFIYFQF